MLFRSSKEDCLVDDGDRSWPRPRQEQSVPHAAMLRRLIQRKGMRDSFVLFRNLVQYLSSSTQLTRDHAQLRVPSNERSNRMEQYSGLNRPGCNGQQKSHQVLFKRNGDPVIHTHSLERDALFLVLTYRFYKNVVRVGCSEC